MTANTPDVLASALPDGVSTEIRLDKPLWFRRKIAEFQAERLAESGYVLVPMTMAEPMAERLARAIHDVECRCENLPIHGLGYAPIHRSMVEAVLAALAGTAAPHERDGEVGS